MKIKLTEKYKPFSHEVGTSLLIPKSSWKVTVYPAKIKLENIISLGKKQVQTVFPKIEGPLTQFTVMQDLERHWIRVFGQGPQGYFSYRLVASSHEIVLFLERGPKEGITFVFEGEAKNLKRKEELIVSTSTPAFHEGPSEKMHFGVSKKQDWTLVRRRLMLEEILPIWFQLGKHIPKHPILDVGTSRLLDVCDKKIQGKECDKLGQSFVELFKVGFEGLLVPRLSDADFQGYNLDEASVPKEASPLVILGEGARLIRRLLVQKEKKGFAILPCLPKELHAGRFTHIHLSDLLSGDLEWSKKQIRRLILYPKGDQECLFSFQPSIKSFRFRIGRKGRGTICQVGSPLKLKKDALYILDRFQK
ncbi:MAG: hypothetical protein KDK76_04135 [Chlamydiia bacterium]|nr:hypothetical protein [Chlamydiia bacterium]